MKLKVFIFAIALILAAPIHAQQVQSVVVTANPLWTDTGIGLTNEEIVGITAAGSWNVAYPEGTSFCGPDGYTSDDSTADNFYLYAPHGALIAYVGSNPYQGHWGDGTFFPQTSGYWDIGSSNQFVNPQAGELWLGFNDDAVSEWVYDNAGSVTAQITINPTRSNSITNGLVAYYPFNGNANDASGNGLNGTMWNSPTFVTGPIWGSEAIHLVGQGEDGTSGQYVTIPSIDFSSMGSFTISLWADIQGDTSSDGAEFLICFGQEPPNGDPALGISYYSPGNSLSLGAGNVGVSSTTTSYLNQWHRYSMVYANGVLTAYFDGQVLGTASGSIHSTAGNAGMGIHWWNGGVSTRFIGSLADVRIYNRALSSQEISTLAGLQPPNNVTLTISACQGGSVSYQSASAGSGTVSGGQSYPLQVSVGDSVSLTANTSSFGSVSDFFSSWSVSSGVTGTGGTPIVTESKSITAVVNSDSQITASFSAFPETQEHWSGYVIGVPNSSGDFQASMVSDVKGSWTVPTVQTSSGSSKSSTWIGIGGVGGFLTPLVQIGTEQDCNSGSPNYYAWWEQIPGGPNTINNFPVSAGDTISAEVSYLPESSGYLLIITDLSQPLNSNNPFSSLLKNSQKV